ncbi:hypothetical protein J6590_027271 [Homalodisca vitripennis]|nr:hypothetical protein J6590_027271 [Homalodisca vitripennis]
MTLDGIELEGSREIAEEFATYFKSVYDSSTMTLDQLISYVLSPVPSDFGFLTINHISESKISHANNKMKSKSSFSPDGILSSKFKGCSDFLTNFFIIIFLTI